MTMALGFHLFTDPGREALMFKSGRVHLAGSPWEIGWGRVVEALRSASTSRLRWALDQGSLEWTAEPGDGVSRRRFPLLRVSRGFLEKGLEPSRFDEESPFGFSGGQREGGVGDDRTERGFGV
ncbi:MAG: hypothetical protein CM15mP18_4100 [Methanobacteriota archaeon]|nr:MAG: hypothetical protein CM15mP18_4100 [Euryarchaeota archaeon]